MSMDMGIRMDMNIAPRPQALDMLVAYGQTDPIGKSIIRRRGTLFVGETYVITYLRGRGLKAGSCEFTVAAEPISCLLRLAPEFVTDVNSGAVIWSL